MKNIFLAKTKYVVNWLVFALVVYSGYIFYLFVSSLQQGLIPSVQRPPSVEGFLPIGALMSLKLWLTTGVIEPYHPAAFVIFSSALVISFLLRKSFCSWICPVGTFSDLLWRIGKRLFGRNFKIHHYVDYPLMSLKYILLAFFVYVIIFQMSPANISTFFTTAYWKVADIKMLMFFTEMSKTTMITLTVLLILSLLFKNFWCRYLCPYGALLGTLSIFSPTSIKRNSEECIKCQRCAKNCPSYLPVDKKKFIRSPECTGCLTCVSNCPSANALQVTFINKTFAPHFFIAGIVGIFWGIIFLAKLTGKWHSSLSIAELIELMPLIKSLAHP